MTRTRLRRLLVLFMPLIGVLAALVALRIALPPSATNRIADALVQCMFLSQVGPIVGTCLAAAAVILCAAIVPWAVVRTLQKEKPHDRT